MQNAVKPVVKAMRSERAIKRSRIRLISPAWRYAVNTLDLLEKERRRSLEQTVETIGDVNE